MPGVTSTKPNHPLPSLVFTLGMTPFDVLMSETCVFGDVVPWSSPFVGAVFQIRPASGQAPYCPGVCRK